MAQDYSSGQNSGYQPQQNQYQAQQSQNSEYQAQSVAQQAAWQQTQQSNYQANQWAPMQPQQMLTTAQKIGWLFVGIFIGIAGILIASLTNIDKPYRSDATKFAIIGFILEIVFTFVMLVGGCTAMIMPLIA